MLARRCLTAATVAAALTTPASAAPCPGITDKAGDTGVFVIGYVLAPTPAPSLDIVKATIDAGTRTTTFRIVVDDLDTHAADAAPGADWQWELTTKAATVLVVARVLPDGGETFVSRGARLHTGPAPALDLVKDTLTWTVPTATLAKAGLTRTTTVAPTISTWRGTAGSEDRKSPVHADFAEGRSVPWGRVGC